MYEDVVGKKGVLYREDVQPTPCKVIDYEEGRDGGDFLLEFTTGGRTPREGTVERAWHVIRDKGTHEHGTFELN